ncbi:MAG: VTT domain-containing protein [Pseudomonadota bacterium]|nr:VTT domain-containing protein [Pseudomonadota bacterium]
MRRLIDFLTGMDARAWRGVLVSFALFGGVGLVFLFGARLLGVGAPAAARHWLAAAHGPWALPAAVAAFAVLAFLGVPQFVLIAAAVVAFGPWLGMAYSWVGTLISSLVGFWLGRAFGARMLNDLRSQSVERFAALIGRNGFAASLIVRLVPFAPFVVVNMAAGATPIRLLDFAAGTGLGIVPKIALTTFGGSVALAWHGGARWSVVWLGLAVAAWIGVGLAARAWLKRREQEAAPAK